MNRLQQAWVWLRRMGHTRGFGIQSPSDYGFVRHVINEHWPYYAYAALGKQDHWHRRKLGRLYFRLANFLQPEYVVDRVGVAQYLKAGCRKSTISHTWHASHDAPLIILPPQADIKLSELLDSCHEHTMLVVEDIGHHSPLWEAVCAQPKATVTFDLYYCGIARFDPKRAKQHYIVNF